MKNLLFLLVLTLFAASLHAGQTIDEIVYFYTDIDSSVIAASDENGEILWKRSYLPFAEGVTVSEEPLGYTGHYTDSSGLIYMGARYYSPELGRFLSIDPIDFQPDVPGSFNRYSYALNSPIAYVDPTGAWAEDLFIGIPSLTYGVTEFISSLHRRDSI